MPAKVDFTSEELTQVLEFLDNGFLMSGLRKIWAAEQEYWRDQGDAEALSPNPSLPRMIQCSARAKQAAENENVIREAVGLKGSGS